MTDAELERDWLGRPVRIVRMKQSCCGTMKCQTVGTVVMIAPEDLFFDYEQEEGFEQVTGKGHVLVMDTGDLVWSSEVELMESRIQ